MSTHGSSTHRPRGVTALSLFFFAGAAISLIASISLLFPGGLLEWIWRINPTATEGFARMGSGAIVLLAAVCAATVATGIGLWRGDRRGWWLALCLLVINLVADAARVLISGGIRPAFGIPIAGLMVAYLLRRRVREFFESTGGAEAPPYGRE